MLQSVLWNANTSDWLIKMFFKVVLNVQNVCGFL